MTISIIIPTVTGREEYLARCIQGYAERTPRPIELIVIHDEPTVGQAWRKGLEQVTGDYIHLTADDVVPGYGWVDPLLEVTDQDAIPCPLVVVVLGEEPGGEIIDEDWMPRPGNPIPPQDGKLVHTSHFWANDNGILDVADWQEAVVSFEHPGLPFCTVEQWERISPMIACHYGTDVWFGIRARAAGYRMFARSTSRLYHYLAIPKRAPRPDDWAPADRLDFDLAIALPAYMAGQVAPGDLHPLHDTPAGRDLARAMRRLHRPPPYHWEEPPVHT